MRNLRLFLILFGWLIFTTAAFAARLKDLATIRGVKENQILGYGMVVGLPGTGDRGGEFTESSLNTALKGMGVDPKNQRIQSKNAAAVIVTASIPPFAKVGAKLDIVISSIASASSLEGGTLMMTPLKGADGKVYAVAQGRIAVSKRADRGSAAFQAMLSAQIPTSAILEREVETDFSNLKELKYQLYQPDFTTAARIAQRINEELGGKFASAIDPGTVDFILPYGLEETPVDVVAKIESIDIEPDNRAKVVINRRSGTVVLGQHVRIFPVAIAHNNIRIQIKEDREPQAAAPSTPEGAESMTVEGPAAPTPARAPRQINFSNRGPSIADIVTSLNEVGATPDDLVFLMQGLKSAGALVAELEMQ